MSQGPIATASVKIIPDLTGFQRLLRAEVNKSISTIKIQPIKVPVIAAPHRASLRNEVNASVRTLRIKPIVVPVVAAPLPAGAAATAGGIPVVRGAGGAGSAAGAAARGASTATTETNALRGALIGLSHVTPVTVFGLQATGVAALAAGLAVASAVKSTADFEHQLNVLQATTGATAEEMVAISAEAKQLGGDLTLPATSAGDAARAMTELAKAGLSVQDTLAGTRGVLQLAAAAQLDVGTAAQFVATELNAFGLAGDKAVHVADLLAGASIAAQGDIRDFATAFQQVSAVAHTANVSLETTTGFLTELAKAGLRGADAGTSIRTFLLRLTPTTKQAAQYQHALNIRLDETKTIGQQLPKLLDQYKAALSGINPILRQQALTQIFGQDAYRVAAIAIDGGSEALAKNTAAANKQGSAAKLAEANAKGLSGAFAGLQSNADTLGITLGNVAKGPLTSFVQGLGSVVGAADKAAGALGRFKTASDKALDFKIPGTQEHSTTFGDKAFKTVAYPFEFWRVAFKTIDATVVEAIRNGREAARHEKELADLINQQNTFGVTLLPAPQTPGAAGPHPGEGATRPTDAQAAANAAASARAAATEAAIRAIQADKKKRTPKAADITPPRDLQIDQLNAQLHDSLQQELAADKAIEGYFRKRLSTAIKGTLRYKNILAALAQAHSATQSVLSQIQSDQNQAQADAKQAVTERQQKINDAVSLQRTRLENAAELADHQGEAERKLIAFYLVESRDLRLEAQARLGYEAAYNTEVKQQQASIAAQAKAEIDLRNARLDLAIQRAGLTPGIADDRRAINAKIKKLQQDIKDIKMLGKLTIEQKLAIVDLQSAILSLQQQAKSLTGQQQGFSLQDLFKSAADQFNTFGSNISARNGVLSGQDERASFGKTILDNRDRGLSLAGQSLTQQEKTNTILEQILAKVGRPVSAGGAGGSPALSDKGKKGNLLSIYGTEIAAAYNYGVN